MSPEEIKQNANYARENHERVRAAHMRMSVGRKGDGPYPGIVPELCEIILKLTAELQKPRERGR